MAAGLSAGAVALIGAGVGAAGSMAAANSASNAASSGSFAQTATTLTGMAIQDRQFQQVRQLLEPYVYQGQAASQQQGDILGLNGDAAQQWRVNQIGSSPMFQSMVDQGENAMRQNAAATGGLRGGNFQGALAQFRPSMLSAAISDQYARLGGIAGVGQNAAAGVGNSGAQMANNNTNLLGQLGAIQAGNALAQGRAAQQGINGITQGLGQAFGALGNMAGQQQGITQIAGGGPSFGSGYVPNQFSAAGGGLF